MPTDYSVTTCRDLREKFQQQDLLRPMRVNQYDAGDLLTYEVTGVVPNRPATVTVEIEKFVGGGFAGQVYRVIAREIDAPDGEISGLEVGGVYAMKILRPPSRMGQKFRDFVYGIGFQAPFSLQVNPHAARAGALWQKFIRRGAQVEFGTERAVVDILATFVDERLGSCGELSEWVSGRTWHFEVDDHLLARYRWKPGREHEGSAEYLAKKDFMARVVKLFHRMGAAELGRQYEWWTCKSQPNALKRLDCEGDPRKGLTAVDFRAGLALLPMVPMSPGDIPLIFKGIGRGSLVQFDRGNLEKLQRFIAEHPEHFADMQDALEDLKRNEELYRDSQIDVTHNHVRLVSDKSLWDRIFHATVDSYEIRNQTDPDMTRKLRNSKPLTALYAVAGLVPGLIALVGALIFVAMLLAGWLTWLNGIAIVLMVLLLRRVARFARLLWGNGQIRAHYSDALRDDDYRRRALHGHMLETLIGWHRDGRVSEGKVRQIQASPAWMILHVPMSILPVGLHRFMTDGQFFREKLSFIFVRPVRLYFNAEAREQWLLEMLETGRKNGMLSKEDDEQIRSRLKEPFIQKYLKSLAVHVCTLPITQIVSVTIAIYVAWRYGSTTAEAWAYAVGILALFQVTPISPGSFARGSYVVYLVIRDRNLRDYNIAVVLGFFKYVGYLAFPIQMAYRYPALARFMAGHWATGAVHIIPVFGESGALPEHSVFDVFYNLPLTLRRRMRARAEVREPLANRSWPAWAAAGLGIAGLIGLDLLWQAVTGTYPTLRTNWYLEIILPVAAGVTIALTAGGMQTGKRIVRAALFGGLLISVGYFAYRSAVNGIWPVSTSDKWYTVTLDFAGVLLWRVLIFGLLAFVASAVTELFAPEPPEKAEEEVPTPKPQSQIEKEPEQPVAK
ncbi:MAG: hypothetical protein ACLFVU_01540 [Phycisphaerae bacterium]